MNEICKANKERFISICREHIKRDGIDNLLTWLDQSDFYTAPASSHFHNSFEGGLCQHSLNVYDVMTDIVSHTDFARSCSITQEQIAVSALFHDLCKVNFYKPDTRNVKVNGVWTTQPYYSIDERFVYGSHGGKSVFLAERFISLTLNEAVAINCHMGIEDSKSFSGAYERCPLAWFLHAADEAATFIIESTNNLNTENKGGV